MALTESLSYDPVFCVQFCTVHKMAKKNSVGEVLQALAFQLLACHHLSFGAAQVQVQGEEERKAQYGAGLEAGRAAGLAEGAEEQRAQHWVRESTCI